MVSIIIPSYNRGAIIHRALDSILQQSVDNWECIVVDDGSTDDTECVVKHYLEKDKRFKYLSNSRTKGAQGARNTGILAAKGDWVVLFDSDNKMHYDFLSKVMEKINNERVDVCSSWSNVINEATGEKVGEFKWSGYGAVHRNLLKGKSYFDNSSTIVRRQLLLDIGLLDEVCPAFQEWDTHIRLSRIARYFTVKMFLVDYYTGATDAISSSKNKDIKGYLFILGKFKREWIRCCPLSFLKYAMILRSKMILNKKECEYEKEYKDIIKWLFRPIVGMGAIVLLKKNK